MKSSTLLAGVTTIKSISEVKDSLDLKNVILDRDSRLAFRVVDEKNLYCNHFTFISEGQGRGMRKKWYYHNETGYANGELMYTRYPEELLSYLVRKSYYLGQNHTFRAVIVDMHELHSKDNKSFLEEITVTKYNHMPLVEGE